MSKMKEAASTEALSEALASLCQYEESVEEQELLLRLLLQRMQGIRNVLEGSDATGMVPAHQEIAAMRERCCR